jgi:hypothetical protein
MRGGGCGFRLFVFRPEARLEQAASLDGNFPKVTFGVRLRRFLIDGDSRQEPPQV